MKTLRSMVWLFLICTSFPCAYSQSVTSSEERRKLIGNYHATEGEVLFFGKVIDQYTNPVVSANIEMNVPVVNNWGPMSYIRKTLQTDKSGCFEVSSSTFGTSKLKAQYLFIDRITANGYSGDGGVATNGMFSFSPSNSQRFRPDTQHPVIYQLRKKLLSEVVLLRNVSFKLEVDKTWSGKPLGYDLIRQWKVKDFENPLLDDRPLFPDLVMKATLNTNSGHWTATFSVGSTNGGINATSGLLYEAPESGYEPSFTIALTNNYFEDNGLQLYLKSREPAIYTRIDVKYIRVAPDEFRVEGETWINPYGDRDMEAAVDLPPGLETRVERDAKDAFRLGKRPVRPDLPKLIREAKAKEKQR